MRKSLGPKIKEQNLSCNLDFLLKKMREKINCKSIKFSNIVFYLEIKICHVRMMIRSTEGYEVSVFY